MARGEFIGQTISFWRSDRDARGQGFFIVHVRQGGDERERDKIRCRGTVARRYGKAAVGGRFDFRDKNPVIENDSRSGTGNHIEAGR